MTNVLHVCWRFILIFILNGFAIGHADHAPIPVLEDAVEDRAIAGFTLGKEAALLTHNEHLVGWVQPTTGIGVANQGRPVNRWDFKPGGMYPYGPAQSFQYEFAPPRGLVGAPTRLIFTRDESVDHPIRAVMYEPHWPEDGSTRNYLDQAARANLEIGEFIGWSAWFGALHRTQKPNVLVGLANRYLDKFGEKTVLRWIIRAAADQDGDPRGRRLGDVLEKDVGKMTTLQQVRDKVREAVAKADLRAARAAYDGIEPFVGALPHGAAGDEIRTSEAAIAAALLKEIQTFSADTFVPLQWQQPLEANELANLKRIADLLKARGDGGRRMSPVLRFEIAKRLKVTSTAMARHAEQIKDRDRRIPLDLYVHEANLMARQLIESDQVRFDLYRFEVLLTTAKLWQSPLDSAPLSPIVRLIEAGRLESPDAVNLFSAYQQRIPAKPTAEPRTLAERAESFGLYATAAMHWLDAVGGQTGTKVVPGSAMSLFGIGAIDLAKLGAFDRARLALLKVATDSLPRFAPEAGIAAYLTQRPVVQLLGAEAVTDPKLADRLSYSCDYTVGPLFFNGKRDIQKKSEWTKAGGHYVEQWHDASVEWSNWNLEAQKKLQTRAWYQSLLSQPSDLSGTEVKGAREGVTYLRRGDGSTMEYEIDQQNTYRIGVGEAIQREAEQTENLRNTIARLDAELEKHYANEPTGRGRMVKVWVKDPPQLVDVEYYSWRGNAVRTIDAKCGDDRKASFSADMVFDVGTRTSSSKIKAPEHGFKSRDPIIKILFESDQLEREQALKRLDQTVAKARVKAWREGTKSASQAELDREQAWREWFLGAVDTPPGPIKMPALGN